jgi:NAD(P)-dependent dehydrogenase (short-subunit alcohol dehydrogenase family)
MTINVKSPFFLTQALLPLLEAGATAEDPARIIMVGSVDGLNVSRLPTYAYGPSKAAVHHLARTLAAHLADRHITANAIAPGLFPSKMTAGTIDAMGESIIAGTPLKRAGRPEDMAGVAIYLASEAASFVTGVVIPWISSTVLSSVPASWDWRWPARWCWPAAKSSCSKKNPKWECTAPAVTLK